MKNLISFAVLMLWFCDSAYSQNKNLYILKVGLPLQRVEVKPDNSGLEKKGGIEFIRSGLLFKIEGEYGEVYLIRILPFKDQIKNKEANDRLVAEATDKTPIFFSLLKSSFNENATDVSAPGFTIGTLNIPMKIRFGDTDSKGQRLRYFDFTSDVNIGLTASLKIKSHYVANVHQYGMIGINPTGVAVDSFDTKGYVKSPQKAFAASVYMGYMLRIDKVQVALFLGVDYIPREIGANWIYQNAVWLGIGVGYSLYSAQGNAKN